jgi:hypothetical protein
MREIVTAIAFAGLMMSGLSACHVAGHVPPGQVKKVLNPPPGHGGVPPGQMKKGQMKKKY